MEKLEIQTVTGPVKGAIRPPGSKSITNRALLCAALAEGVSTLRGLLDSDDTHLMLSALQQLGVQVSVDWVGSNAVIEGCRGRFPNSDIELFVGNSGTTMRFIAAALAASGGRYRLIGTARMHERPIDELVVALRGLGVDVTCETEGRFPPLTISSTRFKGGHVSIAAAKSSQFISGLLMAAPLSSVPLEIETTGPVVSQPYITMTRDVMRSFGVDVAVSHDKKRYSVLPQHYRGVSYEIEPDASAASYFLAVAAICGGTVVIDGLASDSIQGDVGFAQLLSKMGCRVESGVQSMSVTGPALRGIDCDMRDISDTVQTMAAVSLFVQGPTTIRGIDHIRGKETDRIGNLAIELRKLGASVIESAGGMTIEPRQLRGTEINTHDDHRMAMSLALVGLRQPGVVILDPGCVSKTYPGYFEDLEKVTATSK